MRDTTIDIVETSNATIEVASVEQEKRNQMEEKEMVETNIHETINAAEVASTEPQNRIIMTNEMMVATQNATEIINEVTNNNKKGENMNFNFSFGTKEEVVNTYDNKGAYDTLQQMMARDEQLTVKFYTGRDGIISAWIESANVAAFRYQLKNSTYLGLMDYLVKGLVSDFDTNPKDVTDLGEGVDFGLEVMKAAIQQGKRLQYVPLFREQPDYIKAFLPCFKGKIIFRIQRTGDVLDYLREQKQAI